MVAWFALWAACNGNDTDNSSDEDAATKSPIPPGEIGADCADSQVCQSTYCLIDDKFPGNYCSKDCSTEPECPSSSECKSFLDKKLCLRTCQGNQDCRSSYVCDYGVCRPPCTQNEECLTSDSCFQGRCKDKCEGDTDCPDKNWCNQGRCMPLCSNDDGCFPGESCDTSTGRCVALPGKKIGQDCSTNEECATAYCLPTRRICSANCAGSARCPLGFVCGLETIANQQGKFDAAEADCVPNKGSIPAGALCSKNEDCVSNHCYNGFCMEGCAVDTDCGELKCVEVNVVLNGGNPKYKGCLPQQGVSSFDLGTQNTDSVYSIDVPPNATSMILMTEATAVQEAAFVGKIKNAASDTVYEYTGDLCKEFSKTNRYDIIEQISSFYLPNGTNSTILPGVYSYKLGGSRLDKPINTRLVLKLGKATKGTLNINWFFADLSGTYIPQPTLNAASAPTHSWFIQMKNELRQIFQLAQVDIGTETYQDLNNPDLNIIDVAETSSSSSSLTHFQQLLSASKGKEGYAINIFIVRSLTNSSNSSGTLLGMAGGIPGPCGIHGTVHSGIAFSAKVAYFESDGIRPAITLAHEIGHYLGLYHNLENPIVPGFITGEVICPCPCGANMNCYNKSGESWCRGEDPLADTDTSEKNLMYFTVDDKNASEPNLLTSEQIQIILNNPLVGF